MEKKTFLGAMVIGLLVALVVGLWCTTSVYAADASESTEESAIKVPDYQYKLTKKGTYKGKRSSLYFHEGGVAINKDDGFQIVGTNGKPVCDGEVFARYSYWSNGVYSVKSKNSDVNSSGFVRTDDRELIPCEVATMWTMGMQKEDARFAEVVYSTGETTDEDKCFFQKDRKGDFEPSGAGKASTMYMGYARIFDIKEGKFVEGIQLDRPAMLQDFGDTFAIVQDDAATIYDANGKVLLSKEYGASLCPNSRCVLWKHDGKSQIFDANGRARYSTTNDLLDIFSFFDPVNAWWLGDYVTEQKEAGDSVIDFDGNEVVNGSYSEVVYTNGLFCAEGKTHQVLSTDGIVVLESDTAAFWPVFPGYNQIIDFESDFVGKEHFLAKGSNILWRGDSNISANQYCIDDLVANEGDKYLVLNDEKYSLVLDTAEGLCPGLVKGRDADSMSYGVYDLFTGKRLLKEGYDDIKYGADCVWAYANGSWTIYEVELQEK